MSIDISVIVPVAPFPVWREYLPELLGSIDDQTEPAKEVVLVDDAAHMGARAPDCHTPVTFIQNDWNLGEAASRNIAIARARHPWVFQAAYDDILAPACLQACAEAVERQGGDEMGYYYVVLDCGEIRDGQIWQEGEHWLQGEVGGHALFHKRLWAHLGGYPKCGALGLADIGFIDLVMVYGGHIIKVAEEALYLHRQHATNTLKHVSGLMRQLSFQAVRETSGNWSHPEWVEGYGYV